MRSHTEDHCVICHSNTVLKMKCCLIISFGLVLRVCKKTTIYYREESIKFFK